MSGMMLIFLFLLIAIISESPENQSYEIADNYEFMKDDLYRELYREFRYDLPKWNAHIDKKTLIISFNEPEILFERGKDQLKPLFRNILDNFYPRYIKILSQKRFRINISEIRIEGHTSSEWNYRSTNHEAYINNMALSQRRTARVLNYLLNLNNIPSYSWARERVISVGYSSSKIKLVAKKEDKDASRRVEFRVVTNAEEKLYELIEALKKGNNQYANNNIDPNIKINQTFSKKSQEKIDELKIDKQNFKGIELVTEKIVIDYIANQENSNNHKKKRIAISSRKMMEIESLTNINRNGLVSSVSKSFNSISIDTDTIYRTTHFLSHLTH